MRVVSDKKPVRVTDRPAMGVMSRPVVAVTLDTDPIEALRLLTTHRIRHLVVLDANGLCAGVLSDRAIAAAWAVDPFGLGRQQAGQLLGGEHATLAHQATVGQVARFMKDHGVDAVAIVDDLGLPVGVVTAKDLIDVLAA
ncbi:CBS domain-containing protein [Longispora sp. K20-0274]|uniref:CBS domain-containing protein n=1 Tax=Longispora sp. K20-0274 TaxID=3088255 RepID=UPI00399B6DB2